ncbi:hypothetical protein [Roseovarius sp. D22-M7]|uniref:hypothetical protein n=1 Tax=Roseovarius sp. D22-M7 TaxID=3127116 RepID=UPI00300F853F
MSRMDRRLPRTPAQGNARGRAKRAMSVQQALEWAFRVEKARLELPERSKPEHAHPSGVGLEYVLIQRAALGCKVDGGRYKIGDDTHPDAEVIAATVAGLPESLGGKRMAIRVAELARAGLTPDWMPGAVPRCVPVDVRRNKHGERAKTVVVGTARIRVRGPTPRGRWKTVEILACPVTFSPHPEQIASARKDYDEWRQALGWVRDGLIAGGMLREVEVTGVMPKARPWVSASGRSGFE